MFTKLFLAYTGVILISQNGFAYTHAYINDMRSSTENHVFVSQAVEGEFGQGATQDSTMSEKSGSAMQKSTAKWQGYGFSTTLGIETLKFVQFTVAHTFVNLHQSSSSLTHLSGSRGTAGARLVFSAPLINMEVGGGVLGSRYDYASELLSANLYGSGLYYTLGGNIYISSAISFFVTGKMVSEHMVKNDGAATIDSLDLSTSNVGTGFSIWL